MKQGDTVVLVTRDLTYRDLKVGDKLRVGKMEPSHDGDIGLCLVTCLTADGKIALIERAKLRKVEPNTEAKQEEMEL